MNPTAPAVIGLAMFCGGIAAFIALYIYRVAYRPEEHARRNNLIIWGLGVMLVCSGIYLMGVPAESAVTCHWENTSAMTAWVCPR